MMCMLYLHDHSRLLQKWITSDCPNLEISDTFIHWSFLKWGSQEGCVYVMENPNRKWMMTGPTPINWKPPYAANMVISFFSA